MGRIKVEFREAYVNFLRAVAAACLALTITSAQAEQPSGSAASVQMKTTLGWTSNAEGNAAGRSDIFETHSASASAGHAGPGFALRGGIAFETTRYRRLAAEDDWTVGLSLQGEFATSDHSLVTLDAGLDYSEEGTLISAGETRLGAVTPELRGRLDIDFAQQFGATALTLGIGYDHRHFAPTRFGPPLLPPIRTRAHIPVLTGRVHLAHRLNDHAVLTGLARVDHGRISPEDSHTFGRLGATVLRLGAGLSTAYGGRASFALGGGTDIVFARDGIVPTRVLPYAEAEVTLEVSPELSLRAGFGTSVEMTDPADGYLDWLLEPRIGVAYALRPGVEIEAALFAAERTSVAFLTAIEHSRGGELALRAALSDNASLSGSISHKRVSGLAPQYDESRAALTLAIAL